MKSETDRGRQRHRHMTVYAHGHWKKSSNRTHGDKKTHIYWNSVFFIYYFMFFSLHNDPHFRGRSYLISLWVGRREYMPLLLLSIMTDFKHSRTSNICLMTLGFYFTTSCHCLCLWSSTGHRSGRPWNYNPCARACHGPLAVHQHLLSADIKLTRAGLTCGRGARQP